MSFHEELLRFVVAPAKFSFRCLAVDDVSRKSFHNPINGWKVTASVLLFMLAFTSSGLVLYWLTSNAAGIVQQYFMNKYRSRMAEVPAKRPHKKRPSRAE